MRWQGRLQAHTCCPLCQTSPGIEGLAGACWWCLCTRNALLCVQDLPRTFPHNSWVAGGDGKSALRRVLLAFSVHKPEVGYCQSMNYVAAMLLLGMDLDEEKAFWAMVALIDDNGGPSTKRACIDESLIGTLLPVLRTPDSCPTGLLLLVEHADLLSTGSCHRCKTPWLSAQPRLPAIVEHGGAADLMHASRQWPGGQAKPPVLQAFCTTTCMQPTWSAHMLRCVPWR